MSSSELAPLPSSPRGLAVLSRPEAIRQALTQEGETRKALGEYIAQHMVEDVDYGVIPGTKRKTLLKPGAEKLVDLFRCRAKPTIEKEVEVFADPTVVNAPKPFFFYRFKCEVFSNDTGEVVAEGVGSCSSHESKYRYRYTDRVCPYCQKATIIKGRQEYGGGWVCFRKKGGCGSQFADGDHAIEGQVIGKEDNPDVADCANTVLKIAKKRALIDAAITLARCSDLFTQDLDDAGGTAVELAQREAAKAGQPQNGQPAVQHTTDTAASSKLLNETFQALNSVDAAGYKAFAQQLNKEQTQFTKEDWAKVKGKAAAIKDKLDRQAAQQPAQTAQQPQGQQQAAPNSAAANVRQRIVEGMKAAGAKLKKDFARDLDSWLSEHVHDKLTFDALVADAAGYDTGKVAMILGELNGWMENNIPD